MYDRRNRGKVAYRPRKQNNSFVLRAVKDVAFEDRPKPSLRDQNDVIVHVAQTGICGSDVSDISIAAILKAVR